MPKMENFDSLTAKLKSKAAKDAQDAASSVIVGYTAAYSIYVHENLEAHHPVGQAKFLETPARQNSIHYADIIKDAAKQGQPLSRGLTLAGLALQRDSQQLCPVDTGNMRASAFTRLETK